MGAKIYKVLSLQAAGEQPSYAQMSDALVEACKESCALQRACNNMANYLNLLAAAHIEQDAGTIYDLLQIYVGNRRALFRQPGAVLH